MIIKKKKNGLIVIETTYQIKKCVYLCVYIYNLSNKKVCVYNKKSMCIYVCVWSCLDKYISDATRPPQTKILGSAPVESH